MQAKRGCRLRRGSSQLPSKGILAPPRVVNDVLYVYGNGGTLAAYALR